MEKLDESDNEHVLDLIHKLKSLLLDLQAKEDLLGDVCQAFEAAGGGWVTLRQFLADFDHWKRSDILRHFQGWRKAVVAAGVDVEPGTPGPRCESCDTTGNERTLWWDDPGVGWGDENVVEQREEFHAAWLCEKCYAEYLEDEKFPEG